MLNYWTNEINETLFGGIEIYPILHYITKNSLMSEIKSELIEKGIELAKSALKKQGIVSEMSILNIPKEDRDSDGHTNLVRMEGKVAFEDMEASFVFHVVIPIKTHRDEKNWSWIATYNFIGYAFSELRSKHPLEKVLDLWERGSDAVDELIHSIS